MKKGAGYYVAMILALVGVMAILAFGFMNTIKLGWAMIAGTTEDKAALKTLDDAATAIAAKDPTKTVTLTIATK